LSVVSLYVPLLAQSMVDGEITEWMVADGDEVIEGQEILCLGTDKVEQVIPSPATGTIKLIGSEGATYKVGTEIAQIIAD
jgi:pyruvate/2-oxoglutarate dehydrogenase complex dihydrolipoamide acyltransferase (E2) component